MMDDVGQLDRALEDFSKAIELRPVEDVFFYSRGYAHFRKGSNELAIQVCERLVCSPFCASVVILRL